MKDLKQATKQRFVAFDFDYPSAELETEIVAKESGVDAETAAKLVKIAHTARNLNGHGLDEGNLIRGGIAPRDACQMALVSPITDDADIRSTLGHAIEMVV